MNKKEREKFHQFLSNHLYNIRNASHLTHYNLKYKRGDKDDSDFKGNKPARMTMDIDHEYFESTLRYNEDVVGGLWKDREYDKILELLCHEMAHIPTSEPFDRLKIKYVGDAKYYQERLTEFVGRLINYRYGGFMRHNKINKRTGK